MNKILSYIVSIFFALFVVNTLWYSISDDLIIIKV